MYPCLVCGDPVAHHGEWRPWRNVAWTAEFRVGTYVFCRHRVWEELLM